MWNALRFELKPNYFFINLILHGADLGIIAQTRTLRHCHGDEPFGYALWLSLLLVRLEILITSRTAKLLIFDASEKFIEPRGSYSATVALLGARREGLEARRDFNDCSRDKL